MRDRLIDNDDITINSIESNNTTVRNELNKFNDYEEEENIALKEKDEKDIPPLEKLNDRIEYDEEGGFNKLILFLESLTKLFFNHHIILFLIQFFLGLFFIFLPVLISKFCFLIYTIIFIFISIMLFLLTRFRIKMNQANPKLANFLTTWETKNIKKLAKFIWRVFLLTIIFIFLFAFLLDLNERIDEYRKIETNKTVQEYLLDFNKDIIMKHFLISYFYLFKASNYKNIGNYTYVFEKKKTLLCNYIDNSAIFLIILFIMLFYFVTKLIYFLFVTIKYIFLKLFLNIFCVALIVLRIISYFLKNKEKNYETYDTKNKIFILLQIVFFSAILILYSLLLLKRCLSFCKKQSNKKLGIFGKYKFSKFYLILSTTVDILNFCAILFIYFVHSIILFCNSHVEKYNQKVNFNILLLINCIGIYTTILCHSFYFGRYLINFLMYPFIFEYFEAELKNEYYRHKKKASKSIMLQIIKKLKQKEKSNVSILI